MTSKEFICKSLFIPQQTPWPEASELSLYIGSSFDSFVDEVFADNN